MPAPDDDLFGPEHGRVYRETGGERGYNWRGANILLLNARGRKSGEERTMPVIHRADANRWVIVASKGGWRANPLWFENLMADPEPTIEVTDEVIPARAEVAPDAERDRLGKLMPHVSPPLDD